MEFLTAIVGLIAWIALFFVCFVACIMAAPTVLSYLANQLNMAFLAGLLRFILWVAFLGVCIAAFTSAGLGALIVVVLLVGGGLLCFAA